MLERVCGTPTDGDRKPVETSGVYFGSLKTFILFVNTKYRRHTDPNGGYDQNEITE